jgi:hypothetical protein
MFEINGMFFERNKEAWFLEKVKPDHTLAIVFNKASKVTLLSKEQQSQQSYNVLMIKKNRCIVTQTEPSNPLSLSWA